jgi:serine/threonine-protein kinase/endoribonuclease IRE1
MLISDFGLCRKLEVGQMSFSPTEGGVISGGTFEWKAPEILRGEVRVNEAITDDNVGTTVGTGIRTMSLTKLVDIFALGCLYYYCLMSGQHPFGDRFKREDNILRDQKSLQDLEGLDEDVSEAVDLIGLMLSHEAANRCLY